MWVQSCLRTKLAQQEIKNLKMIKKMSAQRTQVVMELYATEINYVSNLEKIVNVNINIYNILYIFYIYYQ